MCRDWQCNTTAVETLIAEKDNECMHNNECVFKYGAMKLIFFHF